MRIISSVEEGQRTILSRAPLEGEQIPMNIRETTFRTFGKELTPQEAVSRIIRDVRDDGDNAVRYYNAAFDKAHNEDLVVSKEEMDLARKAVPDEVTEALKYAAKRIKEFHEQQLRSIGLNFQVNGLGQMTRPLQRVGIYVPGTNAPLPSTALMCAIPARIAGVVEVYIASPVLEDGSVPPTKLVAAEIAGVDAVYNNGGAQAIASLCYIQNVDKIIAVSYTHLTLPTSDLV